MSHPLRHFRYSSALLLVPVLLLAAGCPTDPAGENIPPTISVDIGSTLEHVIGEGLINITVTAEDPEGGNVTIGMYDQPASATFQKYEGFAEFQWAPIASDVTPQNEPRQLIFYADDEFGGHTERVVNVTILAGNGIPRFTNSPSILHNVDSGKPVTFDVIVRDDDSQRVALVMPQDRAPDGAMFTVTDDRNNTTGRFIWEPTVEQLKHRVHSATFIANDGQNDPVEQKVSILFKKAGEETTRPAPTEDPHDPTGCKFEDTVQHDGLGPQRGSDDYLIEARLVGEAAERYDRLVLNWSDKDVWNDLDVQLEGGEMTLKDGVYVDTIPNPLLPSGESKEIYYELCAIDDDSSDDDAVVCGPSNVYYSFIAYSPDVMTCVDDAFQNHTYDTAATLDDVVGWEHHRGCGEGAPDYYRFDLEPQQDGDVFFTYPFEQGVDIEMYDEDRNLLPLEESQCAGFVYAFVENMTDDPTTRYFRVIADDVPYQVSPYLYEARTVPCVETDNEPNDTVAQSTAISIDGTPWPEQQICGPNDVDVFGFIALEGERITARADFVHADGDIDMKLFAPSLESEVDSNGIATRSSLGVEDGEEIELVAPESGSYYLVLFGYGKSNTYTLTVDVEIAEPCQDSDMFAGNHSEADAANIYFGLYQDLTLCSDADDWFKFSALQDEWVTFTLRVTEGNIDDIDMDLFLNGTREKSAVRNGDKLTIDVIAPDDNDYFLQVTSSSEVTYTLTVGLTI